RIALRMTGDDEAVELAKERERRPVSGTASHLGADARERQSRLGLEAESGERLLDETRRFDLFEAELRLLAYALAEAHDLLRAPVGCVYLALLQFVLRHGGSFIGSPWTVGIRPHAVLRLSPPVRRYSTRHGLSPRCRGRGRGRAGPRVLLLHVALVRRVAIAAAHALATGRQRRCLRRARGVPDDVTHPRRRWPLGRRAGGAPGAH